MPSTSTVSRKKRLALSLLAIPLWGLFAAAIITEKTVFITAFLLLVGALVAAVITIKVRSSAKDKRERNRIWRDGLPGTARVISIGEDGSGLNDHPNINFVLDVQVGDQPPYQASTRILIARIAIPRIQPDCELEIRIDRDDPQKVLVDPKLTPYHSYGP